MSPHQFIINLHTVHSENTTGPYVRDSEARHDHPSTSVIDSDSDSLTDDTSTSKMPSLDDEQIELLQLENDLLSLDSSYMGEPDDWDTEVAYNRLNYLIAPTNSVPSSNTHETFNHHFKHSTDSDLSTDQRIPSAISHQINNVIHDSNSECDGSQHDDNLPIPCSTVTQPNETATEMLPDIVLLGDI